MDDQNWRLFVKQTSTFAENSNPNSRKGWTSLDNPTLMNHRWQLSMRSIPLQYYEIQLRNHSQFLYFQGLKTSIRRHFSLKTLYPEFCFDIVKRYCCSKIQRTKI